MKTLPVLLLLLGSLAAAGCTDDAAVGPQSQNPDDMEQLEMLTTSINAIAPSSINDTVIAGLRHMREEEKLARDVYQYFFEKYGTNIFGNIARSEATHMAAVKVLLDRYGVTDPVTSDVRGAFVDPKMTALYTQLTGAGAKSLLDAFIVGATIEDSDIKDLMDLSAGIAAQDILLVYGNLHEGIAESPAFVPCTNPRRQRRLPAAVHFESIVRQHRGKRQERGRR
ncbi:MAG: DUF2202 domain-containing protein [Ignavibacteria bacterium]|nr:DUF2202 domain-containing protein [Ignavibacteria bacterium]